MLKLPPFRHPSNASFITTFRQPTVDDALSFLEADPEMEEQITTNYLDTIIIKTTAPENNAEWTANDRRTALWWIFINIMPDAELTFSYECEHCGQVHIEDINLMLLDEEITTFNELPALSRKLMFDGRSIDVKSQPVTGVGAEMLEEYRYDLIQAIEDDETRKVELVRAKMKVLDAALNIDIDGKNTEEKASLINSMSIPEMMQFFVFIEEVKQATSHGLHSQLVDGKYHVVSPALPCQANDAKEGVSTRLLINFRSFDFIPTV